MDAQTVIKRCDQRFTDRAVFASHWDEVAHYCYPLAGSVTGSVTPGAKRYADIFRNSCEYAHDLAVAGVFGMLVHPATTWAKVEPESPKLQRSDASLLWCADAVRRAFTIMNRPEVGAYVALAETINDAIGFGTSARFTVDRSGQLPLVRARPMREIAYSEGATGAPSEVDRRFELTAAQAVEEYGAGKVGEKIRKAMADGKSDKKFNFITAVYPRRDRSGTLLGARSMPWASVHVCLEDKAVVREAGHHENPWAIARWKKGPGEVYGRGCGMQALADVKMLQRAAKAQIRGAEKVINPALMAEHDGVLSPVRVSDGGINYVRTGSLSGAGAPIRPINTGARPDMAEDFLMAIERIIDQAYYRSLMETLRDPRATATQVLKISEEQNRVLGPILVRLINEDIVPFFERFFMVLWRGGAFLPLPSELQGQRLKVVMVSQLANAQRLSELSAIAQTFDLLAPIRQMDPTVDDNFDTDEIARHSAATLGMPPNLMRTIKARNAMRQARQEAAEQQQAVQQATMLAGAAGAAAPVMEGLQRAA